MIYFLAEISSTDQSNSSRSGSIAPAMQELPHPENVNFYNLPNANLLLSKGTPGGVRVVIVCNSNDSRTLNSLDTIMRTLKASGHSVIQDSQPPENDYLCGSLAIDGRYVNWSHMKPIADLPADTDVLHNIY